jgi:glucose/arabinose dehydrogenase
MGRYATILLLGLLAAALPASAALTLDLQLVTTGVTNPVYVTHAGDDSGRLFIVEQAGRIKIFDGATLLSPPFLDINSIVLTNGSEEGLLSVAFHPGYKTNGLFYVYYTNTGGNLAIARYSANPPSTNIANAAGTVLLVIPHPGQSNHNGGQLQFGKDGYLYIATGDGGSGCDPPNNAQTLTSLLGKMLRIDINTNAGYRIPPTNPFAGSMTVSNEIWSYGLRNPFRFSFDRLTGDLFIGDVGQGAREEINLRPVSGTGGENYGWRLYEGLATNTCGVSFSNVTSVLPIFDYPHVSGQYAVTGGYRYRGSAIAPLFGTYIFCDYYPTALPIIGLTTNGSGAWLTNQLITAGFNISSFGEDEAGEIYVCRHFGPGAIYRIVWRDTDGDGMANDWEQDFFGNTTNGAASVDLDGDGFTNLQEFSANTNPTNALSALRIISIVPSGSGFQIGFASASNKLYRVQRTAQLTPANWQTVTNNVLGTGGTVQVNDPSATNQPNYFYQVRTPP